MPTEPERVRQRILDTLRPRSSTHDIEIGVRVVQVLGAACAPHGPYAHYAGEAVAAFISALTAGLRGLDSIDDPERVATLLVSGLRGILQDRLITGDLERTDRAAHRLISQTIP